MNSVLDLTLVLCVAIVCLSCGRTLLRHFGFSFQNVSEEVVLACGVGLGLLITILLVAGAIRQLNLLTLFSTFFVFGLLGKKEWRWWIQLPRILLRKIWIQMPWRLFSILLAGCWILYTLVALSPTLEGDSLAGYFVLAREFVWQRGIVAPEFIYTASFPANGALLTGVGFMIRGQILAQLTGVWLPGVLAVLSIYSFGRSWISPEAGITAACLWSGTHTVGYLATSGKIDLAWATFDLLALLAFSRWFFAPPDESHRKWLVVSGAFLGVAAGIKQASFLTAALLIGGICWKLSRSGRIKVREVILLVLRFGLPVLPSLFWIWRSFLLTGEPFFTGKELRSVSGFGSFFDTLWQMSMEGTLQTELEGPLGKSIGPVFLATVPFLVLVRGLDRRLLTALLFSGGMLLLWFQTVQRPRHLLPTLGLLAVLSACALWHIFRTKPAAGRLILLLTFTSLSLNLGMWGYINFVSLDRLSFVAGLRNLEQYLGANLPATRWYPSWEVTWYVRTQLSAGAQIAALTPASDNLGSPAHSFYLERPLHGYFTQSPSKVSEAEFLELLRRAGITHVLIYDSVYDDQQLAASWLAQRRFQERYLQLLLRDSGQCLYRIEYERKSHFR